jgi:acetolactate synthase-1/2/3 large subunit
MRVSDFIVETLTKRGIAEIFLVPGGGAMHLNDALASSPAIKGIACHHEQASAISAEAYGRTSAARFGVAMVTTGPGSTNAITPVAGAWIDSLPLLILSGQVKRADAIGTRKIRQGGVQEVDIIPVVRPITKFAATLNDPQNVKCLLEEALWHMLNGRPGPVWIDIPLDVQAAQIDPAKLTGWTAPPVDCKTENEWVNSFSKLLDQAERPLILAGHGVNISGAAEEFRQFAKKHNIPCVFTWNAADLLPFDHPLYIGRPGVAATRAANFAVQNCDLLISIGSRIDNVVTAYNPAGFARMAKKIVVDIDPNEFEKNDMKIDLPITGDAKSVLSELNRTQACSRPNPAWNEKCLSWKTRYPAWENPHRTTNGVMTHYEFNDILSEHLPSDTNVITGSSGLAVEIFYMSYRNREGQRMFLTSGLGAMGYGVSAAIGACIGSGYKQTFCIESDGSLMMNVQELATLKAQNLPVTVIVMNNGGYASIRNTQRNYFNGRFLGSSAESGLFIPDLAALAQSFGLETETVSNRNQLVAAITQPKTGRPRLINAHLTPDEILAPKVSAMPQPDGSIISMPLEDMSPLLPLEVLQAEMLVGIDARSRLTRGL